MKEASLNRSSSWPRRMLSAHASRIVTIHVVIGETDVETITGSELYIDSLEVE